MGWVWVIDLILTKQIGIMVGFICPIQNCSRQRREMKTRVLVSGIITAGVLSSSLIAPATAVEKNTAPETTPAPVAESHSHNHSLSSDRDSEVTVEYGAGGIGGGNVKNKPKSNDKPATKAQHKAWTSGLPSACKAVPISNYKHTDTKNKKWKLRFSVKRSGSGLSYQLLISGKISPSHQASRALMKHECGHVLTNIYKKRKGESAYNKLMNKGWKKSDKMRNEKVADCIADRLGAVRQKTKGKSTYRVGYGTKCYSSHKSISKTFVNYSKNKRY